MKMKNKEKNTSTLKMNTKIYMIFLIQAIIMMETIINMGIMSMDLIKDMKSIKNTGTKRITLILILMRIKDLIKASIKNLIKNLRSRNLEILGVEFTTKDFRVHSGKLKSKNRNLV